jgi:hypothetical protein
MHAYISLFGVDRRPLPLERLTCTTKIHAIRRVSTVGVTVATCLSDNVAICGSITYSRVYIIHVSIWTSVLNTRVHTDTYIIYTRPSGHVY